jgi:prepilin-type N-terminal cleavage/methylation domain-containing protein
MLEMMQAHQNNTDSRATKPILGNTRGFSLAELLMVVAVGTIMTIIAIPSVNSGLTNYRLRGAVSNSTWGIQTARYQALEEGYQFQVVFSQANANYQIQSKPTGTTTFSNVGTPVPLSGSPVTLNQDTTLLFKPNGSVSATTGALSFTITYNGKTGTVTVSNYGNVSVAYN